MSSRSNQRQIKSFQNVITLGEISRTNTSSNFVGKKKLINHDLNRQEKQEAGNPAATIICLSFIHVQLSPTVTGVFLFSSSKAVTEMLEKNYKIHCSLNNIVRCFCINFFVEGCCTFTSSFPFVNQYTCNYCIFTLICHTEVKSLKSIVPI